MSKGQDPIIREIRCVVCSVLLAYPVLVDPGMAIKQICDECYTQFRYSLDRLPEIPGILDNTQVPPDTQNILCTQDT